MTKYKFDLETEVRASYTDEAKAEMAAILEMLAKFSLERLTALGVSCALRQQEIGRPVLTLMAECVRLEINRRVMTYARYDL